MSRIREKLHDRLDRDLSIAVDEGVIDREAANEEIEAVLKVYDEEYSLAHRYEAVGETYLAAQLMFRFYERRGIALRHDRKWADADDNFGYLDAVDIDEDIREDFEETVRSAGEESPMTPAELINRYVELADGLLNGLKYEIHGDRRTDESVRVVCERAGRQFETTTDTGDDEIDVDSLLIVLNRMIEETTLDDRRFTQIDVGISSNAHIFFVKEHAIDYLENYFRFARQSLHRKAQEE